MKNKNFLFLVLFIFTIFFMESTNYATSQNKCTHTVYNTNDNSTYHYYYCSNCGKCNERVEHTFSYSKYNENYHKTTCTSCGYVSYGPHNLYSQKLLDGEVVNGVTYSGNEDLDTYHKIVCSSCGDVIGVEKHTWTGGNTSPHKCGGCGYFHSKKDDATKGRHYFDIEKIRKAGKVTFCEVCNQYLRLTYPSDSILSKLPKKEEYTMVGNPTPMEEVVLDTDQKIKCNFMPINEER